MKTAPDPFFPTRSARRGSPYGSAKWAAAAAERLGIESSLRKPGRPKKPRREEANP